MSCKQIPKFGCGARGAGEAGGGMELALIRYVGN